ncbi:MAG: hypothetical protein H8E16_18750 [Flavobacteriales bacterium]|nr:hypothetical protein [Flavobacteriales bacterium]
MIDESGLFSQAMEAGRELLSPLATQREENAELTEGQERVNDNALRDVMDSANVGGGDVYSDQVFDEVKSENNNCFLYISALTLHSIFLYE